MAARKSRMPGAPEEADVGAGAGAGAVAENNGQWVYFQEAGSGRPEGRLARSVVRPLPLASRYGGAKHDSVRPASEALQSTWIQRLRPASPDVPNGETGHGVAQVWRDPKPTLWSSKTPLLLAGPSPKDPSHHCAVKVEAPLEADDGTSEMGLMAREEAGSSRMQRRKTGSVELGLGRGQVELSLARELSRNTDIRKVEANRPFQPQQAKPLRVFEEAESFRRKPKDLLVERKNGMAGHSARNQSADALADALVTGFGPLRVRLNGAGGADLANKTVGDNAKCKGPLNEGKQPANVPPGGAPHMPGLDRPVLEHFGRPPVMPWGPGSSSQAPGRNSLVNMEMDDGRHVMHQGELYRAGFYPVQGSGYGSEGAFMIHQWPATGKDRMGGYHGFPMGNGPAGGFIPVGEGYPIGHTMDGWHTAYATPVDGASSMKCGTHPYDPRNGDESRADYGQQNGGKYHAQGNREKNGKHAHLANGLEGRKAKEVYAAENGHSDVGRSHQQVSHVPSMFAPYLTPAQMYICRQSVHCATPDGQGRANRDGGLVSKTMVEKTDGALGRKDDGAGALSRPVWSSIFAGYELTVHGAQKNGNRATVGANASGNQVNDGGYDLQDDVHPSASAEEARSPHDNQSSHFSSSPWPIDENQNPADDAGSAFHSQASYTRAPYAPGTRSENGVEGSSVRDSKDVSYQGARSKEPLSSDPPTRTEDLREARLFAEENHAQTPESSKQVRLPSSSGHKDDTSDSSPPSLPVGCNINSVLRSPAFPLGGKGKSTAVLSGGVKMSIWPEVGRKPESTGAPRDKRKEVDISQEQSNSSTRGPRVRSTERHETAGCAGKKPPEAGDRAGLSSAAGDDVKKHIKLRRSSDAVGEADWSGPHKRSRAEASPDVHEQTLNGHIVNQENGRGAPVNHPEKASGWLSRWLSAGSKTPGMLESQRTARREDRDANALALGNTTSRRMGVDDDLGNRGQGSKAGGHLRNQEENGHHGMETASKRAVFGLPPFQTPSAAALALVGTANRQLRKLSPLPLQRKGPAARWQSNDVDAGQSRDSRRTGRNGEYVARYEHSTRS